MSAEHQLNPPTDTGACGEYRGYKRHFRQNETPCPLCKEASRTYQRRILGIQGRMPAEDIIEEIDFFLSAGRGQHEILNAIGNPTTDTLKQLLHRNKRPDLITKVFKMDEIGVWAA